MIVELGHFALVLALLVAILQMVVPAWGAHGRDPRLMAVGEPAARCQFGLLLV
jgi:cytochrome c-type biogenesis protein CcmF